MIRFYIMFAIFTLAPGDFSWATGGKTITLAAFEQEPYIGTRLSNKGYVHELVVEAYRRSGYEVFIEFYPLARAKHFAEKGAVDGLVPYSSSNFTNDSLVFSTPFPGSQLGLLKKKDAPWSRPAIDIDSRESLEQLQKYNFGVVRGASISTVFDQADFLKKDLVALDLQNIKRLAAGRIDFALIDKFTAADLITGQLPDLIGKLEFVRPVLKESPFHLGISRSVEAYREKLEAFNTGLAEIKSDGTLERILGRHGLFPGSVKDDGIVSLTIGTVDNQEMKIMEKLSVVFEESHPGIRLNWKVLDEETLRKRLSSDLAISDGYFDIMTVGGFKVPLWAEREWLLPVGDLSESYDSGDLVAPIRETVSYEGRLFALPFYSESSMTYYRKDLFREAGITMAPQPTYDNIQTYAEMLHDPGSGVSGLCLRGKPGWGSNMCYFATLVNSFGGRWFGDGWEPAIDTPEWKAALETYKNLVNSYGPENTVANNYKENLGLFAGGRCAMWIDATVATGYLSDRRYSTVYDRYGVAPAPIENTAKGAHWLWTWALAIPASSYHEKEAREFIAWATSKEYIELVAESEGWAAVPPGTRYSTYDNKNYREALIHAPKVLDAIEKANPVDNTSEPSPYVGISTVNLIEFPALGDFVGARVADAVEGKMSVDEALRVSQEFVSSQMVRSGYIK